MLLFQETARSDIDELIKRGSQCIQLYDQIHEGWRVLLSAGCWPVCFCAPDLHHHQSSEALTGNWPPAAVLCPASTSHEHIVSTAQACAMSDEVNIRHDSGADPSCVQQQRSVAPGTNESTKIALHLCIKASTCMWLSHGESMSGAS